MVLLCFVVVLVAAHPALATDSTATPIAGGTSFSWEDSVILFFSGVLSGIAIIVTKVIVEVIDIVLLPIMHYNAFSTSPVVAQGWSVVRDLVNMFFVVVLLIIAFQTIFNSSRAHWQQQVPKLLIMAIVINFSRTIAGLLIDVGQVVMFTFVNAIANVAGGNFINLLGLNDIFTNNQGFLSNSVTAGNGPSPFDYLGASFLSIILVFLVLATMMILCVLLAFRIVVLWVLVIMSPLTFFLGGAKGIVGSAGSYYADWWTRFTAAVSLGPILTFFVWLSLAAASSGNLANQQQFQVSTSSTAEVQDFGLLNNIFQAQKTTSMIIGIALLFAGFEVAQSTAHNVGKSAGHFMEGQVAGIPGLARTLARAGGRVAAAPAGYAASRAGATNFRLNTQQAIGAGLAKAGQNLAETGAPGLSAAGRALRGAGIGVTSAVSKEREHHLDEAFKSLPADKDQLKLLANTPKSRVMSAEDYEQVEAAQLQLLMRKDAGTLSDQEVKDYAETYYHVSPNLPDSIKNKIGESTLMRRPEIAGMQEHKPDGSIVSDTDRKKAMDEQVGVMAESPNKLRLISTASLTNAGAPNDRLRQALRDRKLRYQGEEMTAYEWIEKYGDQVQKDALKGRAGAEATAKRNKLNGQLTAIAGGTADDELRGQFVTDIRALRPDDVTGEGAAVQAEMFRNPLFARSFVQSGNDTAIDAALADNTRRQALGESITAANVAGLVNEVSQERLRKVNADPAISSRIASAINELDTAAGTDENARAANLLLKTKAGFGVRGIRYNTDSETFELGQGAIYRAAASRRPEMISQFSDQIAHSNYDNELAIQSAEAVNVQAINQMAADITNPATDRDRQAQLSRALQTLENAVRNNAAHVTDANDKLDAIREARRQLT